MSMDAFETIFTEFKPVDAQAWKDKIIQDLKGASFEQLISHQEGIDILPFYTLQDNAQYHLEIPVRKASSWVITEEIVVEDVLSANKSALQALHMGAESILFDVQNRTITKDDAKKLVQGILLEVAPVHFLHFKPEDKTELEQLLPGSCTISIEVPLLQSSVEELVYILTQLEVVEAPIVRVQWQTGSHYFMELAKLRALRWLWKQANEVLQKDTAFLIVSKSGMQKRDAEDVYTNMLRNTTEAMSAISGGCDELIIASHDIHQGGSAFGKRIARNIHHILQSESYFNELSDAAKGSYYIEYLTWQLAQKAWEKWRNV